MVYVHPVHTGEVLLFSFSMSTCQFSHMCFTKTSIKVCPLDLTLHLIFSKSTAKMAPIKCILLLTVCAALSQYAEAACSAGVTGLDNWYGGGKAKVTGNSGTDGAWELVITFDKTITKFEVSRCKHGTVGLHNMLKAMISLLSAMDLQCQERQWQQGHYLWQWRLH